MTLAKARARMEQEKGELREIRIGTFTALINELVRRYANGEIVVVKGGKA
jgi:hypothetical protein